MPHGKWLIPDDWNLATGKWEHYCIAWPKSFDWYVQLKSLMFALTRGREWDELSGNIQTAQAIGWEIFKRNHLLVDLCGDQDGLSEPQNGPFGASIVIEGDEDMGQVVTDVTIVNGKLTIWFGPCCSKTLEDFIASAAEGGITDDPLNPSSDPDFVYSACGKALAVVRAVYSVLTATYDGLTNVDWPWQIMGNIEHNVGYNLIDKWVAALLVDWSAYGIAVQPSDVFSAVDQQVTVCNLVHVFSDDPVGVPDDATYESLKSAFHTRNFLYDGLIMTAIAALGRANLDTIAKLGAGDLGQDCECPGDTGEILFEGVAANKDWRYVWDFRTSLGDWILPAWAHRTDAIGLWADSEATQNLTKVQGTIAVDQPNNGSTLEYVGIRFQTVGDENFDDNQVKIGTDEHQTIAAPDVVNLTGDDPANAGIWTVNASDAYALGIDDNVLSLSMYAYHAGTQHPDEAAYSVKVIGVLFAGSGPGPLANPPA